MSEERDIEFHLEEPDYWYAEFDVENKVLDICLGEHVIRIPQETVLSWMMINEYQEIHKKGDQEDE